MSPDSSVQRPVLYDYWRSTAAYRVRIVLNLKGITYVQSAVNLAPGADEQHGAAFRSVNPAGLVPALAIDGRLLTQSLAICEYLEETRPQPALLPTEAGQRAWVRALVLDIACDVHPINNLRVQQRLRKEFHARDDQVVAWMDHWMRAGFAAIEQRLNNSPRPGRCCLGSTPGLADVFLVAQAYNADRFGTDLSGYTRLAAVIAHCRALPAFRAAAPEAQPDAPAA